eukprot:GHVS01108411.1.p1 GENE.GHVS01108411.1~~GHVS01108411.1.p1  ORF type:complete len:444 (+),score=16.45 GHVS01108411.1:77-1408(+)
MVLMEDWMFDPKRVPKREIQMGTDPSPFVWCNFACRRTGYKSTMVLAVLYVAARPTVDFFFTPAEIRVALRVMENKSNKSNVKTTCFFRIANATVLLRISGRITPGDLLLGNIQANKTYNIRHKTDHCEAIVAAFQPSKDGPDLGCWEIVNSIVSTTLKSVQKTEETAAVQLRFFSEEEEADDDECIGIGWFSFCYRILSSATALTIELARRHSNRETMYDSRQPFPTQFVPYILLVQFNLDKRLSGLRRLSIGVLLKGSAELDEAYELISSVEESQCYGVQPGDENGVLCGMSITPQATSLQLYCDPRGDTPFSKAFKLLTNSFRVRVVMKDWKYRDINTEVGLDCVLQYLGRWSGFILHEIEPVKIFQKGLRFDFLFDEKMIQFVKENHAGCSLSIKPKIKENIQILPISIVWYVYGQGNKVLSVKDVLVNKTVSFEIKQE